MSLIQPQFFFRYVAFSKSFGKMWYKSKNKARTSMDTLRSMLTNRYHIYPFSRHPHIHIPSALSFNKLVRNGRVWK